VILLSNDIAATLCPYPSPISIPVDRNRFHADRLTYRSGFISQLFSRVDTCTSDFFRIQALPFHSAEHYRMEACSVSAMRIKDSHDFNDQDFLIRYRHGEDRHQDFLIRRDIGFGMDIEKSVIGRPPGFGLASRHRFAQREQE
jgi:hypothetical protein